MLVNFFSISDRGPELAVLGKQKVINSEFAMGSNTTVTCTIC
jgi:hypothetical protein